MKKSSKLGYLRSNSIIKGKIANLKVAPDTDLGYQKMKKLVPLIVALFVLAIQGSAQINGQFYTAQDGHIYFQGVNTTGTNFYVTISAVSSDRSNSETIAIGQGFVLGPSTPWRWFWKRGDKITVTYPNGQNVYWTCSSTDNAYLSSSPSFRGSGSDGYIYKGYITLTRISSGKQERFYHFNKGGTDYVATLMNGPYYRLARRMIINNIDYNTNQLHTCNYYECKRTLYRTSEVSI